MNNLGFTRFAGIEKETGKIIDGYGYNGFFDLGFIRPIDCGNDAWLPIHKKTISICLKRENKPEIVTGSLVEILNGKYQGYSGLVCFNEKVLGYGVYVPKLKKHITITPNLELQDIDYFMCLNNNNEIVKIIDEALTELERRKK